jgi:hypothetical protein
MLHLGVIYRVDDYIAVRDGSGHRRYSTVLNHITAEKNAGSKISDDRRLLILGTLDRVKVCLLSPAEAVSVGVGG